MSQILLSHFHPSSSCRFEEYSPVLKEKSRSFFLIVLLEQSRRSVKKEGSFLQKKRRVKEYDSTSILPVGGRQ